MGDMTPETREPFASDINSEILAAVRSHAKSERRQLDDLLDEAFADLIEKRKKRKSRSHVMEAYLASQENMARCTRSSLIDRFRFGGLTTNDSGHEPWTFRSELRESGSGFAECGEYHNPYLFRSTKPDAAGHYLEVRSLDFLEQARVDLD